MSLSTNQPIAELEPPTKAKIRSTQILASLPHLISELVQNSLDAGASCVEVGLDPVEWECWVRDDGQGMSAEGLEMLGKGHEKGRYNTSKSYKNAGSSTFGFRGEALASAMELSCLEISSRTIRGKESRSVIIKGGEQLYLGPSVRWRRERPGTTVVARDIFYNIPVRRKSHPNATRTLELTKKEVETLALVFPHVSFSLDHMQAGQTNRILTIARTTSSLATFRALYGGALVGHVEEINLCSEDLRLEGFISLEGSQSRAFQNFYVNRHPMAYGEIQRAVEKSLVSSAYTHLSFEGHNHYTYMSHPRRPPRRIEKKPVYVLNLSISASQVDNFVEPAKSMVQFQDMSRVLAFILEAINRVLAKQPQQLAETTFGIARKRTRRLNYYLDPVPGQSTHALENTQNAQGSAPAPLDLSDETLLAPTTCEPSSDITPLAFSNGFNCFEWTDPSSGESFLVDPSTGNSFPSNRLPGHLRIGSSYDLDDTPSSERRSLNIIRSDLNLEGKQVDKIPPWLAQAMQYNSTFRVAESTIPSAQCVEPRLGGSKEDAHTRDFWKGRNSTFPQSSKIVSDTFSASDLKKAQVVAQVDTKFIACLFEGPERTLALVDQHAADERVRVERYLKKLCSDFLEGGVEVLRLHERKAVLLTRREADILVIHNEILGRWGLWLESDVPVSQPPSVQAADFIQASVTSVPNVVANKLVTRQDLERFVKSMIAAVETDEVNSFPLEPSRSQDETDWVKALRYCPMPVLELVNSKACRGAIMFNDPLDQDQCERLIYQLSKTIFPFQCAHGRPSVAPLVKLPRAASELPAVDWGAFVQEDW